MSQAGEKKKCRETDMVNSSKLRLVDQAVMNRVKR
jgi:hypothetical protein